MLTQDLQVHTYRCCVRHPMHFKSPQGTPHDTAVATRYSWTGVHARRPRGGRRRRAPKGCGVVPAQQVNLSPIPAHPNPCPGFSPACLLRRAPYSAMHFPLDISPASAFRLLRSSDLVVCTCWLHLCQHKSYLRYFSFLAM